MLDEFLDKNNIQYIISVRESLYLCIYKDSIHFELKIKKINDVLQLEFIPIVGDIRQFLLIIGTLRI